MLQARRRKENPSATSNERRVHKVQMDMPPNGRVRSGAKTEEERRIRDFRRRRHRKKKGGRKLQWTCQTKDANGQGS